MTGQRGDGYHLLDSLVVFASVGDVLRAQSAPAYSLQVTGPEAAAVPLDDSNLVLRAARVLSPQACAAFHLRKTLPAQAGLGGGSSDAAAALRLLAAIHDLTPPEPTTVAGLGADVPVCLWSRPARMRGIGDQVEPFGPLPEFWMVLVNPGVKLSTPQVFAALGRKANPALPAKLPRPDTARALAAWLGAQRNDLEPPAIAQAPTIRAVLDALRDTRGCLLARMSGSGASCFGMYQTQAEAEAAAQSLRRTHFEWWVRAAAALGRPDQVARATT